MTAVPVNGRRPVFDLDQAAAAARAAADHSPFVFTWRGESYELPPVDDWTLESQRQLAAGELAEALGAMLGDDVVGKLAGDGMTLGDIKVLFEAVGAGQVGTATLPNSLTPPPPGSTVAT